MRAKNFVCFCSLFYLLGQEQYTTHNGISINVDEIASFPSGVRERRKENWSDVLLHRQGLFFQHSEVERIALSLYIRQLPPEKDMQKATQLTRGGGKEGKKH